MDINDQVKNEIKIYHMIDTNSEIKLQFSGQVWSQAMIQVQSRIRAQIESQLKNQVIDQVYNDLYHKRLT
jgi:hypothetical protein